MLQCHAIKYHIKAVFIFLNFGQGKNISVGMLRISMFTFPTYAVSIIIVPNTTTTLEINNRKVAYCLDTFK